MTERNGLKNRAEVAMTEGRTEGRAEKERRATRPTPVQMPRLDSGLPRSVHAAIARSHLDVSALFVVGRVGCNCVHLL